MSQGVSGKPIALFLGALLIGAALFKWWPSDERAVRRQLDNLADTLTVPSTDIETARLTRLAELRNYFAPEATVRLDAGEPLSRQLLLALAERWAPPPGGIFVEFAYDSIAVGDGTATVALTADASSRDPGTGEITVERRDARLAMVKRDGVWLIAGVEPVILPGSRRPESR